MLSKDTIRLIEDNAKEILDPLGFELIELKSMNSSSGLILRFLVDRLEGGITLNECAQLNRDIGKLLEEKNIISEEYALEVFSPGLDRPLLAPGDFRRTLEKKIHIFLKEEKYGKLELEGKLIKLDGAGIYIKNNENDELSVPFTKINRAKRVIK
ncbi:ribosome maturation factor RimP [Candidatus Omnitrophota bacterium]